MYGDTLTWGGIAVATHGLSMDCQSHSGIRGYSDIGGGIAVAIHGRSRICQSNSGVGDTLT